MESSPAPHAPSNHDQTLNPKTPPPTQSTSICPTLHFLFEHKTFEEICSFAGLANSQRITV